MRLETCKLCGCPSFVVLWAKQRRIKRKNAQGEKVIMLRLAERVECEHCQARSMRHTNIKPE